MMHRRGAGLSCLGVNGRPDDVLCGLCVSCDGRDLCLVPFGSGPFVHCGRSSMGAAAMEHCSAPLRLRHVGGHWRALGAASDYLLAPAGRRRRDVSLGARIGAAAGHLAVPADVGQRVRSTDRGDAVADAHAQLARSADTVRACAGATEAHTHSSQGHHRLNDHGRQLQHHRDQLHGHVQRVDGHEARHGQHAETLRGHHDQLPRHWNGITAAPDPAHTARVVPAVTAEHAPAPATAV